MLKFNSSIKLHLLALLLLSTSFFVGALINKQTAYAEEQIQMKLNSTNPEVKIEYDLAYPGILPSNPLYKLKVLRDKVSLFLITDPLKRIEFYLLQADKGILAAAMLIDENKIELSGKTALKAEHNMTLVTYELKKLSKKPSNELIDKLKTASKKHQEVLISIANRVSKEDRKTFITVNNFSKTNLQTIEKLQSKKYYNQQ